MEKCEKFSAAAFFCCCLYYLTNLYVKCVVSVVAPPLPLFVLLSLCGPLSLCLGILHVTKWKSWRRSYIGTKRQLLCGEAKLNDVPKKLCHVYYASLLERR